MTHEDIIKKAVQKAKDNGWVPSDFYEQENWDKEGFFLPDMFWDKSLAKALWGEGYETDEDGTPEFPEMGMFIEHNWQHHLQQMVVADDPIEYLGNHLS